MIARVAFGATLILAAADYSGTLAQSRAASDALLGRWDLVVQRGTQTSPSWLEVERSGTATLVGQFVGSGGSARPIAKIELADGTFRFAIPPQWDSNPNDITFEGRLDGDRITGSMTMGDGQKQTWSGTRAPALRTKHAERSAAINGRSSPARPAAAYAARASRGCRATASTFIISLEPVGRLASLASSISASVIPVLAALSCAFAIAGCAADGESSSQVRTHPHSSTSSTAPILLATNRFPFTPSCS